MTRPEILDTAKKCVCGDREQDYGSPESNFQTIADLWAAYLQGCGVTIDFLEPHDVAAMLALLKIARIASGHAKADNWVDLAGYAACGGEIQSVAVNPVTPDTEGKPVEPWGEEDEHRINELLCGKPLGESCYGHCPFSRKALKSAPYCNNFYVKHPAEARKIMDEMEGMK